MSLYHILTEYLVLENESASDEEFAATLEALEIAGRQECIELAKVIKNKEAMIKAIAHEIDAMNERSRKLKQQCKTMKKRLLPYVRKFSNSGFIDSPNVTIKINQGRGRVEVTDEDSLPNDFFRWKKEPDKEKINAWLSNGETVDGAVLVKDEVLMIK